VIQKETHSKVKSILEALDIGKDEKRRGDAEWSSSEEEDEGEEGDDPSRTPLGGLDFKMESTQEKRSTDMVPRPCPHLLVIKGTRSPLSVCRVSCVVCRVSRRALCVVRHVSRVVRRFWTCSG